MSQFRENPSHEPFNSFKLYVFQTTDYLPKFFTWAVLIALLVSLSLVLYSAFTSPTPTDWFPCPDYQAPTRFTYKIPDGAHNVSGQNVGPTNISHIVFGIGGSAKTWTHRRRYSELWWQPSITRGYVWLDETPDPNTPWPVMSPPYPVSENSSSQSAVRIARIVSEAFRLGLPDVRWFVMGDDDTVFFTDNLVSVLSKYDHRSMYYVGGNSESVEQNEMHSYEMAFGGGGFAISYPLAAELVKVLDGCIDRYYNFYGSDQRVWACVKEIGVSLTKELGFHQECNRAESSQASRCSGSARNIFTRLELGPSWKFKARARTELEIQGSSSTRQFLNKLELGSPGSVSHDKRRPRRGRVYTTCWFLQFIAIHWL